MRHRGLLRAMLLALSVTVGVLHASAQPGVDWVGMTVGKFDLPETAQYAHVTLIRTAASRLGGTWGAYTLVGAIEDSHIDFTLTDASGAEAGFLRGTIGQDMFSGIGTIVPARQPGSNAVLPQVEVKWTLTRGAVPPGSPKIQTYEPVSTLWVRTTFPGDGRVTELIDPRYYLAAMGPKGVRAA